MAGTCQYCDIFGRNTVFFREVFRYNHVVIGYDALNGSDDELILDFCLQLLQVSLQIRRRSYKDKRIRLLDYIVDV